MDPLQWMGAVRMNMQTAYKINYIKYDAIQYIYWYSDEPKTAMLTLN